MRHMASGGGVLKELNDLRAPMDAVFSFFKQQRDELARYKQMYGELPAEGSNTKRIQEVDAEDD